MSIDKAWPISRSSHGTGAGFLYDRTWVIVDQNRVALSQKRFSTHLTKLQTQIDLKLRRVHFKFDNDDLFEMNLDRGESDDLEILSVSMNGRMVRCHDEGEQVSAWLTKCFKFEEPCRLLRITPGKQNEPETTSFSNKADFLLVNESSVRKLRKQIDHKLEGVDLERDMDMSVLDHFLSVQFRPNIIIKTLDDDDDDETEETVFGFDEESWTSRIEILNKSVRFELVEKCTRCQMININQNFVGEVGELVGQSYCENLLKELYRMRSSSKFGVYLASVCKGAIQEAEQDPALVGLSEMRSLELAVGDIGKVDIQY
jgi:uncharacterized protein YcbX